MKRCITIDLEGFPIESNAGRTVACASQTSFGHEERK